MKAGFKVIDSDMHVSPYSKGRDCRDNLFGSLYLSRGLALVTLCLFTGEELWREE